MKTILFLFTCLSSLMIQAQHLVISDTNNFERPANLPISRVSFRGLSVLDNATIWVSGSRSCVGRSTDGGQHFRFSRPGTNEKADFRDIEAFDTQHAIVMSSGSPATVYITSDGGNSWQEVYHNADSAYFLDAMAFWNRKEGVILADPIAGKFVLLLTSDGGKTWQQLDTSQCPDAFPQEAAFAASGTCIATGGEHDLFIVSGGSRALLRKATFTKSGIKWQVHELPMVHGKASQGAFSVYADVDGIMVVGGDYQQDTSTVGCAARQAGEQTLRFNAFLPELRGYRSCVTKNAEGNYIVCGTSGVDELKGLVWEPISSKSFNVVQKAKQGKAVYLAGNKGLIARLVQ